MSNLRNIQALPEGQYDGFKVISTIYKLHIYTSCLWGVLHLIALGVLRLNTE